MKHLIILLSIVLTLGAHAQSPQAVSYQCVVRDAGGAVLSSQTIALRARIHQGTAAGTVVYEEIHHPQTNQFGLATLSLGLGSSATGTFGGINWASGQYFLEIDVDVANGTSFTAMGTQQLVSVPYALYADKANERQTLSISGNQLSISPGNSVTLPNSSSGGGTGIFQQALQEDVNYSFVTSTSEPGADSFLAVFAYSPPSAINYAYARIVRKDPLTGSCFIAGNAATAGQCGGGNGVYITSAVTHRGTVYYSYGNGCAGHVLATPTGNVTYDVQPSGSNGVIFTDGQYVYVNNGSNWLSYSANGNQFTLHSTFNFSTALSGVQSIMCDGTYFFVLTGTALYKFDKSTGNLISQKIVYGSPTGMVDIDATKLYLTFPNLSATGASNQTKGGFTMLPLSKP